MEVFTSPGNVQSYNLTKSKIITIGKDKTNEICIDKDTISRKHATIQWVMGLAFIEDCRSLNKTKIFAKRGCKEGLELLSGKQYQVIHDNVIQFGDVVCNFIMRDIQSVSQDLSRGNDESVDWDGTQIPGTVLRCGHSYLDAGIDTDGG